MTTTTEEKTSRDLDWLKRVAGIDDPYINRWTRPEWDQWSQAMAADPEDECPNVPAWMRPLMPQWSCDFSLPFPCVAQLWPTTHDWFADADRHTDLTLVIEGPSTGYCPSLTQVRQAWDYAISRNGTPSIAMTIVPGKPVGEAVVGEIEAFYIGNIQNPETLTSLERILDHSGKTPTWPLPEGTQAWEWMYS